MKLRTSFRWWHLERGQNSHGAVDDDSIRVYCLLQIVAVLAIISLIVNILDGILIFLIMEVT